MTKSFPPHVGCTRMSPTTETWFTGLLPAVLSTVLASLLTAGAVTGCHGAHRAGDKTSGDRQTNRTNQTSTPQLAGRNGSRVTGPGAVPTGGSEVLELRRPSLSSQVSSRGDGRFYRGEDLICTFWLSGFTAPSRHLHLQSLLRLVGPKGRVLLEKGPATLVDQAIPAGRSMHRVQMRLTVALSNVEPAGKHRLWITMIEPATKRYGRLPVDFVVGGTNRPPQSRFAMERVRFSTPADLRPGGTMHISGILRGLRAKDERPTAKPGHPRWRIRLDAIVQVADRATGRTTLHRLKVADDLLAFAPTFFPLELDVPIPNAQPPTRYDVKIQLYTVPGQVKYNATRRLVLRGVDGVVFVADSMAVRREKNLLSLKNLQENLAAYQKNIFKIPLVLQYNKRDLAKQGIPLLDLETIEKDLNSRLKVPSFGASALKGTNVVPTLKKIIVMTMASIQKDLK